MCILNVKYKNVCSHLEVILQFVGYLERAALDQSATLAVYEADQLHRVAVSALHHTYQSRYHLGDNI